MIQTVCSLITTSSFSCNPLGSRLHSYFGAFTVSTLLVQEMVQLTNLRSCYYKELMREKTELFVLFSMCSEKLSLFCDWSTLWVFLDISSERLNSSFLLYKTIRSPLVGGGTGLMFY